MKRRDDYSLIQKKLDLILKKQNQQLREQEEVTELEREQLEDQEDIEALEKKQLRELDEIEKQLKKEIGRHPLRKITIRDFSKGIIGALIAITSHFAFAEGVHIAERISGVQAGIMFAVSFLLGSILLYSTGYRKVKDVKLLRFMPLRICVIYVVALFTVVGILTLFKEYHSLDELYKQVAVVSIPAVIGSGAADLLGKE